MLIVAVCFHCEYCSEMGFNYAMFMLDAVIKMWAVRIKFTFYNNLDTIATAAVSERKIIGEGNRRTR